MTTSNLKIISDNAGDRATLTASSTAGSLAVTNMQSDGKVAVWRSTSLMARLTALWAASEQVSGAALPFCNLTPAATIRLRTTNEGATTNLLTYTEHLDNAAWNKLLGGSALAPIVSPDYTTAPDGSFTADRIKFNLNGAVTSNDVSYVNQFIATPFTGGTGSVWLKTNDGSTKSIWIRCSANQAQVSVTPTWQRFSITEAGAGCDRLQLAIYGNSSAQTADLSVWGCMVAAGTLSSYYPSVDTFTSRASTGTFIGSNGLIQSAAINVSRVQYNPGNLSAPPKLLLEGSGTNKLLYSRQFSNAAWAKSFSGGAVAATVTDNFAIGPDGTTTSARLQLNLNGAVTGSDTSYIIQSVTSFTGGTASVYLKTNDGTTKSIWFRCSGVQVQISVTGLWQRFSITEAGAGCDRLQLAIYGNSSAQTADLLISDAQLETGLYATSVITTTSTAVTRSADVSTSTTGTKPAGYIDTWQSYDYDSGTTLACPAATAKLRGFTALQAQSAYGYGGGAYARQWMTSTLPALGMAIDLADPGNTAGYLEAARLVTGAAWSPAVNPDYGIALTIQDRSKAFVTDAGDLLTDIGTRNRKITLPVPNMAPPDRTALVNILRSNGTAWPHLISVFPGSSDLEQERDYMVYGKLSAMSAVSLPSFSRYSASLDIEEI